MSSHYETKFKLLQYSIYVPVLFLVALVFSLMFFRLWPVRLYDHGIVGVVFGSILFIIGTVIIILSEKSRHHNFFEQEGLVCDSFAKGIYKRSRHPGTFGFLLLFFGFACFLNSVAVLITVFLHFFLLSFIFVPVIERETARLCGDEYKKYQKKVRMWL